MNAFGLPITFVLTAVTGWALLQTLALSATSRLAPLCVVVPTLALLLVKLVRDVARSADSPGLGDSSGANGSPLSRTDRRVRRPREARLACWGAALLVMVYLAGLPATIPLFLFACLHVEADLSWARSGAVALGAAVGFHLLFARLLAIPLPPGLWP
jgi:hypothetical protein